MNKKKPSGRKLKNKILKLLTQNDFKKGLREICQLPARQVVNPLFSFLYSLDEIIKWRSITALGEVTARLAENDLESSRIIMRRLMWNLNDESGGIGWGSPEAMGEIMARSKKLADEYAHILVSYIRPDGNFLEHEVLQRGVLWGLGRLAHARPDIVQGAAAFLTQYLASEDPVIRGLAVWAAESLPDEITLPHLKQLTDDKASLKLFIGEKLVELTVGDLAQKALAES
ncbi:MAG: HEAT repeat domain-containing protein [Deltaproteobacteria bacterium]|nr:MAG: HEAT repeat domain-containing protein [Deltaproteobacteria bacterium]